MRRREPARRLPLSDGPDTPPIVPTIARGRALTIVPGAIVAPLRGLATNLAADGQLPPVLALTAALSGEGVTTCALALAAVIANDADETVALVEANFWHPNLAAAAGIPGSHGLAEVLGGEIAWQEAMTLAWGGKLALLPAGRLAPERRAAAARGEALARLVQEIGESYDRIILDVPGILSTTDAVPLASLADASVLVIRQGATPAKDVRQALDRIAHLKILGTVLNATHLLMPKAISELMPGIWEAP